MNPNQDKKEMRLEIHGTAGIGGPATRVYPLIIGTKDTLRGRIIITSEKDKATAFFPIPASVYIDESSWELDSIELRVKTSQESRIKSLEIYSDEVLTVKKDVDLNYPMWAVHHENLEPSYIPLKTLCLVIRAVIPPAVMSNFVDIARISLIFKEMDTPRVS